MTVLVAGVDDVEEHPRSPGTDGQKSHVVQDEHGGGGVGAQLGGEVALPLGGQQLADHVVAGGEVAPVAGLDGQGRQGDGQVGLAAAGLAEEHDRPALLDEAQRRQILHQLGVDGGLEVKSKSPTVRTKGNRA